MIDLSTVTKEDMVAELRSRARVSQPNAICKQFTAEEREARQESFYVMTMNGANEVITKHVVSKGLLNRALVHPREVFYPAIIDNANSIIIAHNHPSGNTVVSHEDTEITHRLVEAGKLLGIQVLDHVVITSDSYLSFLEEGILV